jgi:hypothetical protein
MCRLCMLGGGLHHVMQQSCSTLLTARIELVTSGTPDVARSSCPPCRTACQVQVATSIKLPLPTCTSHQTCLPSYQRGSGTCQCQGGACEQKERVVAMGARMGGLRVGRSQPPSPHVLLGTGWWVAIAAGGPSQSCMLPTSSKRIACASGIEDVRLPSTEAGPHIHTAGDG